MTKDEHACRLTKIQTRAFRVEWAAGAVRTDAEGVEAVQRNFVELVSAARNDKVAHPLREPEVGDADGVCPRRARGGDGEGRAVETVMAANPLGGIAVYVSF